MSDDAKHLLPASSDDDPGYAGGFGVHAISEFAFCDRAGIISMEQSEPEMDEEPRLGPKLDVMFLEERRLIEAREHYWRVLRQAGLFIVGGLGLSLLISLLVGGWVWPLLGLLPILSGASDISFALPLFLQADDALKKYRAAKVVPMSGFDPTRAVRVDWWDLRKSGMDCQKLRDALQSRDRLLGGIPWRVMVTPDNWMIPVIWRPAGSTTYGLSQAVRLAAYCRLLEDRMQATSPFGIIWYRGTTDCDIVPITDELRARLDMTLRHARQIMGMLHRGTPPSAPTDQRCRGCRFGQPRRCRPGSSTTVLAGVRFPPVTFHVDRPNSKNSTEYHSDCGDRFQWTPPHANVEKLRDPGHSS